MKNLLFLSFGVCCTLFAANPQWDAKGSAVLIEGFNQAGNKCIMAAGSGKGSGYGGLQLSQTFDLRGATAKDCIKLKTFQNISWLTIMLRGKNGSVYRALQLPSDGTEVVIPFDRKNWKTGAGTKDDFLIYDSIILYASFFKHPSQMLGITDFVVTKDGKELYAYHSENKLSPRKYQVFNLGLGGDNSMDVIKRQLDRAIKLNPTLAIVMVGTNDMNNIYKRLSIAQYEKNLRSITDKLTTAGAKVILITPPPCIESVLYKRVSKEKIGNANENIQKVCSVIHRLAAEKKCILVDYNKTLLQTTEKLETAESYLRNPINSGANDGVHPTSEGYAVLSKLLSDAIKANNLPKERIVCLGDSITFGAHMLGAGTSYGNSYPGQLAKSLNNEK